MGRNLRTAAVDALKLPKDVVLGETMISMEGGSTMLIENYRSILLYEADRIKLLSRSGKILIEGSSLQIEYYDEESMKIIGRIKKIEFQGM